MQTLVVAMSEILCRTTNAGLCNQTPRTVCTIGIFSLGTDTDIPASVIQADKLFSSPRHFYHLGLSDLAMLEL